MSFEKLHRDDQALDVRPDDQLVEGPHPERQDHVASERLATIALSHHNTNGNTNGAEVNGDTKAKASVGKPSAEGSAEVAQMFRDENGPPAAKVGKPSAEGSAEVAQMFRDENGPPAAKVGKPSAEGSAEVAQMFRDENGPPAAKVGKPSAEGSAEVAQMFRDENGPPAAKVGKPSAEGSAEVAQMFRDENGPPAAKVGKPSAEGSAEVMQMFREENSADTNRANGVGRPSASGRAEVMEMFREENGPPAAETNRANGVGKPPSAKDRAEVMEMFREENGPPAAKVGPSAEGSAPAAKIGKPSAEGSAEVMQMFREENGPPAAKVGKPSAEGSAEVMQMFREENGPPAAKVGKPSAEGSAEVMQMFRDENGPPAAKVGKPSAEGSAEVMQMFREENSADTNRANGVGKPPSAKDRAEVMEMFREVNGGPEPEPNHAGKPPTNGVGKPPSAKDRAEVMEMFREVNGGPEPEPNHAGKPPTNGVGKPPSAANAAAAMQDFREVNGDDAKLHASTAQGHELDPAQRMARVAIDQAETSLDEKQPGRKKKDAAANDVATKQAPNTEAQPAHDKVATEDTAALDKGAAKDVAKDVAHEDAHATGLTLDDVRPHATGLTLDDVRPHGKTDANHVDGHGMGVQLDGPAKPDPKHDSKPDAGHVDGHGTALTLDDVRPHKPDPTHVDNHGTGLALEPKPGAQPAHGVPEANHKIDGHGTGLVLDQPGGHAPIVDGEGNAHEYNPHSGKAPSPKPSAGAHAGGFAHPAPAPEIPPPPQTANQQALNAFIAKARADRDAQKGKVQAQQLAKSAQVSVDANVIAQQVKRRNEEQLVAIRAKAEQEKAAAASRAAEQQKQEGPVTIASLTTKLETTATADKEKLKADFDEKQSELKVRLATQRETLKAESQKQIDNFKTQQDAKKKGAEAAWKTQKAQMETTAKTLMEQMRHQVEADQKRLEKDKDALFKKANERMAKIDADTKTNADKVIADGEVKANGFLSRANTDATLERAKGATSATSIRNEAQTKAGAVDDDAQKKSIIASANSRASSAQSASNTLAENLEIKGKLNAKAARDEALNQSNKVKDAGKKAHDDVNTAAAGQVAAIATKINELLPLAQEKIKKAEADLQAKQKAGEDKLAAQFADSETKIAKMQADADAKIGKLETDATTKLQKDFDAALAAIDKRVAVARQQLATGNEKNLKALEQMVDQTCKSIDKTVVDTQAKFDHTVQDAERQAQAFVMEHLAKIKAEADKALHAIDQTYDDCIQRINDAATAVTKHIEETAKGKMLEVEVHTATLLNDIGDSSRLDAVKKQLETYIKEKKPLPEGYGEQAAGSPPPAPTAAAAAAAPAAAKGDDKTADKTTKGEEPSDADKAAAEAHKKLLDPTDLTEAGIKAKLEEALKKGRKQTADTAADNADQDVAGQYKKSTQALTNLETTKNAEVEKLKAGDKDAVAEVQKVRDDKAAGDQAAKDIDAAMKKTNWYGGKSPDKKAILSALEGKNPEQIAAMKEALAARTPPINLDDFINKELSGDQQVEARVRMTGDPRAGDIAALTGAAGHKLTGNEKLLIGIGGGPSGLLMLATQGDQNMGADKARVEEILRKYKGDDLKKFAEEYEKATGRPLGDLLHSTGNDSVAKELGVDIKKDERSEKDIEAAATTDASKLLNDPTKKINGAACGKATGDLVEALQGFHLDSTRADNVRDALKDKTPDEMAYLRAEYKAKTGHDLDRDLEAKLNGASLQEAKATLRNDKTSAEVAKILGSEEASWTPWTVDDKKMQDTLKELKDPAQRRAVLDAYEKKTGRKLQDVIAEKMTGNDRELAGALADGDELKARMVELDEATNGGWMNGMHKAIHERTGLNTEPYTRGLANAMINPAGITNPDAKVTLPGGYVMENGSIHKVDSDAMFKLLEDTPNPADREKLKALYKEKTHRDMDDDMAVSLVGPMGDKSKLDAYKAIQEGRMDDYYAAKMDDAVSGLNDTKAFHAALEGKSESERKAIIDAFNKRHGNDPNAFMAVVDDQFGADSMDAKKAKLLASSKDDAATGTVKLPDEFVLQYAQDSVWNRAAKSIDSATAIFDKYPMLYAVPIVGQQAAEAKAASYFIRGWGVDNDAIKGVLKGKSKEEIEELKLKYPDLEKDLGYCLSGRDAFEVDLMLKEGEPQTPEAKIKRQLAMYEFDRGASGTWIPALGLNKISNGITDLISPSGQLMDNEAASLRTQLATLQAGGQLTAEQSKQLEVSLALMDSSTEHFIASREEITGAIATAVGAVVGAVVTVLTGGVGGAILAALATGLSTVAVKCAMLGQSYGRNEMGVDLAMTAVQMATAGLGGGISKLSQTFLTQVLNGAIGAAASQFVQTAITSKDAHDLLGLLAQASKSGLVGLLSGGANAAATAALANAMASLSEKAFGPNAPLGGIFVKGFVSGAGGSVAGMFATAIVDPSVMSGNWDAVVANTLRGAAEAGFQNGLTEAAQAHHERAQQVLEHAAEAAKQAQAEHQTPEEQRAVFAKEMAAGYAELAKETPPERQQTPEEIESQREKHPPAPENQQPPEQQHEPQNNGAPKDEVAAPKVDELQKQAQQQAELAKTAEMPAVEEPKTAKTEPMPVVEEPKTAKTEELPAVAEADKKPATVPEEIAKTQEEAAQASTVEEAAKKAQTQIEEPPLLQEQVDKVTGVEKGPEYEKAMQDLRDFYAHQELEAQQVAEVSTRRTEQMQDAHGNPLTYADGSPYGYQIDSRFDVRQFSYEGQNLTEVTIKVHLDGSAVTPAEIAKIQADALAGVDQHYNNGQTLSNGDRLHVNIEFVPTPAEAHLTVNVHPGEGRADQVNWYVDSNGTVHAHELGHQMGLIDEYHDQGTATPAIERATPTSPQVHDDHSLMGDFHQYDANGQVSVDPQTEIKDRHLDQIQGDIENARQAQGVLSPEQVRAQADAEAQRRADAAATLDSLDASAAARDQHDAQLRAAGDATLAELEKTQGPADAKDPTTKLRVANDEQPTAQTRIDDAQPDSVQPESGRESDARKTQVMELPKPEQQQQSTLESTDPRVAAKSQAVAESQSRVQELDAALSEALKQGNDPAEIKRINKELSEARDAHKALEQKPAEQFAVEPHIVPDDTKAPLPNAPEGKKPANDEEPVSKGEHDEHGAKKLDETVEGYNANADKLAGDVLADRPATPELSDAKNLGDAAAIVLGVEDLVKKGGLQAADSKKLGNALIATVGQGIELGAKATLPPAAAEQVSHLMDVLKAQVGVALPQLPETVGAIVKALGRGDLAEARGLIDSLRGVGPKDPGFQVNHEIPEPRPAEHVESTETRRAQGEAALDRLEASAPQRDAEFDRISDARREGNATLDRLDASERRETNAALDRIEHGQAKDRAVGIAEARVDMMKEELAVAMRAGDQAKMDAAQKRLEIAQGVLESVHAKTPAEFTPVEPPATKSGEGETKQEKIVDQAKVADHLEKLGPKLEAIPDPTQDSQKLREFRHDLHAFLAELGVHTTSDLAQIEAKIGQHADPETAAKIREFLEKIPKNSWGVEEFPKTLHDDHELLTSTDKKTKTPDGQDRAVWREEMVQKLVIESGAQPCADGERPVLYIMGGGGASGKGFLKKGLQGQGVIPGHGAVHIDPDGIKTMIPEYKDLVAHGDSRAASVVHEESSALAKDVLATAYGSKLDVVYDVTLGDPAKGKALLQAAKAAGYEIRLYGVSAEAPLAIERNLSRAKEEGRYVPPEEQVKAHKGFSRGFESYAELADEASLYDTNKANKETPPTLMASKEAGGKLQIHSPEEYEAFQKKGDLNLEAKNVGELNKEVGEIPKPEHAPTEQEYIDGAMENLQKSSRTAQGTVDTSAGADKAKSMAEGVSDAEAQKRTLSNYSEAIGKLYHAKEATFESPEQLRAFVEGIAGDILKGVTKEGELIRKHEAEKLPYTKVSGLEGAMKGFYEEFHAKLQDPNQDPVSLAAWVEYRINLTDHFYADGCGKISAAISAWVLMRAGQNLPENTDRKTTYANAPVKPRGASPESDARQEATWEKHYRRQFEGKETTATETTETAQHPESTTNPKEPRVEETHGPVVDGTVPPKMGAATGEIAKGGVFTKARELEGAVFGETGPHPSDVAQGQLGDCYLLSTLQAVAKRNPQLIRDMIRVNPDGTYTVTFRTAEHTQMNPDGTKTTTPAGIKEVTVSGLVPELRVFGTELYASSKNGGNWPQIIEKAYAHEFGGEQGYKGIGEGGYPSQVMDNMFGLHGEAHSASTSGNFDTFKAAFDAGAVMVAQSRSATRWELGRKWQLPGAGPVPDHAWAVMDIRVDPETGAQMVELYNPHNTSGKYGSRFSMPYDKFVQDFTFMYYSQ